jgi:hypothetical protein
MHFDAPVCFILLSSLGIVTYFLELTFKTKDNIRADVWAHGSVGGWDTMPQTGRSRVRFPKMSLDFWIYLILSAAIWPWGRLSLWEKWVPGIFLRGKGRPACKVNLSAICEPIVWRKCGSLDVSKPYDPLLAVTGRALLFTRRWENSIDSNLIETSCDPLELIYDAQDRHQSWDFVNTRMNLGFP